DLPARSWLEFYASRFDTVEINNSFYRLPDAPVFAAWRRRVPRGFEYAVKASRYLTHMKKLKDPADPLDRFFSRARELGPRLGPRPPRSRTVRLCALSRHDEIRRPLRRRDARGLGGVAGAEDRRRRSGLCVFQQRRGRARTARCDAAARGHRGTTWAGEAGW